MHARGRQWQIPLRGSSSTPQKSRDCVRRPKEMLPLHAGPLKKCGEGPLTLAPLLLLLRIGSGFTDSPAASAAPKVAQFGLKSRYTDQRQLLRGPTRWWRDVWRKCSDVWIGIRVGASDDKLLPLISPLASMQAIPVIRFTSQDRSRSDSGLSIGRTAILLCLLHRHSYRKWFGSLSGLSSSGTLHFWRPTDWDYLLIRPNLK